MPHPPDRRPAPSQGWRELAPIALLGTLVAVAVLYAVTFLWRLPGINDFYTEAWPAYRLLDHGHVLAALRAAPFYAGSLILRAPFAMLASALGGSRQVVYFASAVPCLAASPILGVWLVRRYPTSVDAGRLARISPFVLCGLNPFVVDSVVLGHPEDVLGAALCVAAVLVGCRGSARSAGVLLGLALINKTWAFAALPVVLVVMPSGRRSALLIAGLIAAAVLVPVELAHATTGGVAGAATSLGSSIGTIFLSPQLLWWLGPHAWIVQHAHPLIILVGAAAAGGWWVLRNRRSAGPVDEREALLLLAFVMLLRAALDPWDNVYYHLPFLFALMAYETGRTPRWTILSGALLLVVVPPQLLPGAPATHALLYALVAGPMLVILAARLYLPPGALPQMRITPRRAPVTP